MSLETFLALRGRFERFVYESSEILEEPGSLTCRFHYRIQGKDALIPLTHQVRFVLGDTPFPGVSDSLLRRAVFLLGLAEAVSYWKTACPPLLEVWADALSPQEVPFWEHLYTRGLGEFWYLNGIYGKVPDDRYIRVSARQCHPEPVAATRPLTGALVPVGGGKDSVVSLELLKRLDTGEPADCFLLSARQAAYDTALLAGYARERQVEAFRVFDPQLFAMNREGYLNGHVPYSAILGFTAVVAALLRGRKHIVLSNEGSANEPTVPGTWVNHQYSKSLEFEMDFRTYLRLYLTPQLRYFSLLRPWSEARIAMEFVKYPVYHAAYRSCNRGSKENRWCCACSKCLFVFLLMAAHAGAAATTAMFGENLLEKEALIPTLDELAGFAPVKPFECVGTVSETCWSLDRLLERPDLPDEASGWPLLRHYTRHAARTQPDGRQDFRLVEPELGGQVPWPFRQLVLPDNTDTMGRIRQLLSGKRIGILGFGLEGRSTLAFLRQTFPEQRFIVADKDPERLRNVPEGTLTASGDAYARALEGCDLVFKSPGIPWMSLDTIFRPEQITSQTDLFLAVLGDRTIGVTGTKGKSTTSALVHAGLAACGYDAAMVGNMGIPALDAVLLDQPERVYVCELSSHMLETIRHAPRGAVYLNLYEDHLDHYRSFEAYAQAKDNLVTLQTREGFAVVGESVRHRVDGCRETGLYAVSLLEDGGMLLPGTFPADGLEEAMALPVQAFAERALPGAHNLTNLRTAFLAVHLWESLVHGQPRGLGAPALSAAALMAMNGFSGLPHRMRLVGTVRGIRFWDDSISTIPEACQLAVETIGDVDTLIFGGLDRGISYHALVRFLADGPVKVLIGLPDTGHRILDELAARTDLSKGVSLLRAENLEQAVALAFARTEAGRSCLLSPAAASYGWYRNFEERGDHFARLVLAENT